MFTYKEFIEEKFDYTKQGKRNEYKTIGELKKDDVIYVLMHSKIIQVDILDIEFVAIATRIKLSLDATYFFQNIFSNNIICPITNKQDYKVYAMSTDKNVLKEFSKSVYYNKFKIKMGKNGCFDVFDEFEKMYLNKKGV